MTPEQEKAIETTIGTVQRVAMKIAEVPRSHREQAFTIARRNYEESFRRFGHNPNDAGPQAWLEKVMQGIRLLVAQIDNSGGAGGGHA